ncbi:MAG: hypothetical protein JNM95_07690 [Chitinophagaceae bacterium]|nr:hypothetical protein [Chitinophagaceae bacterium]
MKKYLLAFLTLLIYSISFAQTARISLEHNGTSTIYSTLQAAYNAAVDDDIIILPGGTFTIQDSIKKRLNFIGAGISLDSTQATSTSKLSKTSTGNGNLIICPEGNGTSFNGIHFFHQNYSIGISGLNGNCQFSLFNCFMQGKITKGINCLIKNCLIGNFVDSLKNSVVKNTICEGFTYLTDCSIDNSMTESYGSKSCITCDFRNCIFNNGAQYYTNYYNYPSPTCNFYNCLRINASGIYPNTSNEFNTISIYGFSTLFNSSITGIVANPAKNYHLLPNSPGSNAGTDGTDIGIYGGLEPCPDGWVPSNPHIMVKSVSTSNTNDGKLNVNFKVRKGN